MVGSRFNEETPWYSFKCRSLLKSIALMSFSSEKSCLQTLNVGAVAKPILPPVQRPVLPAAITAASQLLLCMRIVLLKLHSKQIVHDHLISYTQPADVSPTVVTPSNSHCVPSGEAADTLRHGPTALPIVEEEPVIQAQVHRSEYSEFEGLFSIYNPMSSLTWNSPPAHADDDNPFLSPAPTAANVRFDLPSSPPSVGAESFASPSPTQSELDKEQGHQVNTTPN